nr:immunoglobulin heavy chain junction region [Macaca mulatta]MOV55029.1 immunoglobulin heavy chain junction region [Macaca mulatta]MOV55866.1 immunoglobulin heavy chain junction region [Macaca mulatta]MOV58626.1 immunoglobulin heavy chain junction region [Macaca mulatta]
CASVSGDCSGIFCFTSYGLESW